MLKLERILVATDFSLPSQKALRYGIELAQATGGALLLLHVVPPPSLLEQMAGGGDARDAATRTWVDERLRDMLAHEVPPQIASRAVQRSGSPAHEIVAVARDERASLIVVATRGQGGLANALTGSTAERVVREAPCPVLTVHEREQEFITP